MPRLAVPVSERDHIPGNPNAPLTLLEYGDYDCPYCGAAHPIVKPQGHPHAEHAAEAAEAAGAQGKFWEMHDTLFEHQDALDDLDLVRYAVDLGLDVARFEGEMAAHVHAGRVREDFLSGVRSGVNGTPTFFINGRRHDGSYDLGTLVAALEAALAGGAITGAP
jgi:protein-disulfide isomerase